MYIYVYIYIYIILYRKSCKLTETIEIYRNIWKCIEKYGNIQKHIEIYRKIWTNTEHYLKHVDKYGTYVEVQKSIEKHTNTNGAINKLLNYVI